MTFKLITSVILSSVENTLNNLLAMDTSSRGKLHDLAGTTVAVDCTAPRFKLLILIHENGLHLSPDGESPDTTLRGSMGALLGLLRRRGATGRVYGSEVEVMGDMETLQRLQGLLLDLDIDWEYYLSRLIGDVPTQALSDTLETGRSFARQGAENLRQDLDEYLHEEKKWFPSRQELEAFYGAVHALRLDVDRLAARINNLKARLDDQA